jgi:hypothetical protein
MNIKTEKVKVLDFGADAPLKAQLMTKKEAYKRYLQTRSYSDYNLYARARNQAKKFVALQ